MFKNSDWSPKMFRFIFFFLQENWFHFVFFFYGSCYLDFGRIFKRKTKEKEIRKNKQIKRAKRMEEINYIFWIWNQLICTNRFKIENYAIDNAIPSLGSQIHQHIMFSIFYFLHYSIAIVLRWSIYMKHIVPKDHEQTVCCVLRAVCALVHFIIL